LEVGVRLLPPTVYTKSVMCRFLVGWEDRE
jgi:hypothetical protein